MSALRSPEDLPIDQAFTIRDYIQNVGGYGKIFRLSNHGELRLRLPVDVLITSCGNGRIGEDRWLSECAEIAGEAEKRLESLTLGNIGGYWLARDGLGRADREVLAKINARWNGIVVRDIESITAKGTVILLAAETYKGDDLLAVGAQACLATLY